MRSLLRSGAFAAAAAAFLLAGCSGTNSSSQIPAVVTTPMSLQPFGSLPATSDIAPVDAVQTDAAQIASLFAGGSYMFVVSDMNVRSDIERTATSATRLAADMYYSDPIIARRVLRANTYIMRPSLEELRRVVSISQKPGMLMYDFEQWNSTPLYEQAHAAQSFAEGADIAHDAGYKFGVSISMHFLGFRYLGRRGCSFNYSSSILPSVNWGAIDTVNLQVQRPANPNCSKGGNFSQMTAALSRMTSYIRSHNPRVYLTAELSMAEESPSTILAAARAVRRYVNGIGIAYPPPCSYCSAGALLTVLRGV